VSPRNGLPDLQELLRAQRDGVLATLSARRDGWPFASVTQYALSPEGDPFFLLSGLAEHTRNLLADARASLLIQDRAGDDPLAAPRITLLGRVESHDAAPLRASYLERHPQASEYLQLADFRFYLLRVSEARFVSGFGDMGWIDGDSLRAAVVQSE
jgi:putative heme iron utilization protein